jgi:hypothetical protein
MSRVTFRSINADETCKLVFDFSSLLAVGETISSASVSAAVYSGATGSTLTLGTASIVGAQVSCLASAGTEGVTYLVTCVAVTSLSQHLPLSGFLAILSEAA